jgi:uncharacterized protein (TIGR00288 family)
MSDQRVMLLIDADNVSVDVMDQAVRLLLKQHGALHVRRAYCTAESAVANQAAFKRLSIKPMVNLAAGKNSTDIALAVDAIDLVLAERPDVVVIASSDSDFAPLVQRLREKGCEVRGIGQLGKTAAETQDVYDDYTVLEHHKAEPAPKPARKTAARKAAAPAAKKTAAKKAPAKKAAAKTAKSAALPTANTSPAAPAAPMPPAPPDPAAAVLDRLPELRQGGALALNVAVHRLREAQLMSKSTTAPRFFARFGPRFSLLPPDKPTQVRFNPSGFEES